MKKFDFEKVRIGKAVAEGFCLAHAEGKTFFVRHAAPGDLADIHVYQKKKGSLFAEITQLHESGPDRIGPRCEHFGLCGGCKWQHLTYEAQIANKQNQVKENFDRIGHLEYNEMLPILGSQSIFDYRNRLDFGFSHQRYLLKEEMGKEHPEGLEGLGFHIPGRFDKILDVKKCHLQGELSNRIRLFTRKKSLELGLPFYDLKNHKGIMRSLIIRTSTLNECMVILAFALEDDRNLELLASLKAEFPEITSLLFTINPKKNETIYDLEIQTYHGKDHMLEQLGDCKFMIGPKSFFQTNSRQAEVLYQVAKDFAGLEGHELVYDLYTGTGSIALYVADKARKVVGVEYVEQAIEDAKKNAALNSIEHVSFYAGNMKEVLNDAFVAKEGKPDVIITDPPRAGMDMEVVEMLLKLRAPKVVYVSCNAATQARDLGLMRDHYTIEKVQPVDMFPHTHHVENVVLLTLKP
ncbi:MAG: 23S rRNA (uracil(1939)-C(5))-methyltransferase RlmD [Bacteroidetes bacterium]|nr:MAG: 23S rRNA (uracil(1939)-C(5))-methyltransferase RlmD [Bacteroidota bacterium]